MNNYRINYIDGHDMRYKSFETVAENTDEALLNLWDTYKPFDFDHQVVEIIKLKEPAIEGLRIGEAIPSPNPTENEDGEELNDNILQ